MKKLTPGGYSLKKICPPKKQRQNQPSEKERVTYELNFWQEKTFFG